MKSDTSTMSDVASRPGVATPTSSCRMPGTRSRQPSSFSFSFSAFCARVPPSADSFSFHMTICLITSFAPVRVGSAICLEPLPVGRWTPFHRSLSFVGSRVHPRKKAYHFDHPETIRLFHLATYRYQDPTSEGRQQAYQTYRRQWTVSVGEAVRLHHDAE
ncbi:hypothetical protein BVI2075_110079 [Burkholderia vietnamiensis]|nr:hypothetical protein BVI2075_110079 [Burkholderia vietnamiensis]